MSVVVVSVSASPVHGFSKAVLPRIQLRAGLGVEGDAHAGTTVQHRSRVARDPHQPNLRQVHLIADELLTWLSAQGFRVDFGDLGENVVTRGVDLIALPVGSRLRLGPDAVVELTGLRNPCAQIEAWQSGLLRLLVAIDAHGRTLRRAGVMAVVLHDGAVAPGDAVRIDWPPPPHIALDRV